MANPPIRKSIYTRERCIQCIRECTSCQEFQQRYFAAWRQVTKHYPDLKELYPWKRRPHRTPEQRKADEEAKAQRKAEREARAAERNAEHQERRRRYQERLAEQAIVRKQREEEKAQRRAQREAEAAERKAKRDAQLSDEREQKHRIKVQRQRDYIEGNGNLAPACRVKWTEDRVREACLECGSAKELRKRYRRAFNLLYLRYPHLLKLFPHHKTSGYLADYKKEWTRERCREMCRPYKTLKELRDENPELYFFIQRHGWSRYCHQDITGNPYKEKPTDQMSYKYIQDLIIQHDSLEDFAVNYPMQYQHAMRTKTLRQTIESHFPAVERRRKHDRESIRIWQESQWGYRTMREGGDISRVIYACEFPDHCAYVGLTADPAKRCREHGWISNVGNSAVADHKWKTGHDFEFKVLTDFLPEEEARKAEGEWERKYAEEGWTMLNVAPTGSLGGSGVAGVRYWDEE